MSNPLLPAIGRPAASTGSAGKRSSQQQQQQQSAQQTSSGAGSSPMTAGPVPLLPLAARQSYATNSKSGGGGGPSSTNGSSSKRGGQSTNREESNGGDTQAGGVTYHSSPNAHNGNGGGFASSPNSQGRVAALNMPAPVSARASGASSKHGSDREGSQQHSQTAREKSQSHGASKAASPLAHGTPNSSNSTRQPVPPTMLSPQAAAAAALASAQAHAYSSPNAAAAYSSPSSHMQQQMLAQQQQQQLQLQFQQQQQALLQQQQQQQLALQQQQAAAASAAAAAAASAAAAARPPPPKPKPAMTPAETMKKYSELLTPFEQSEILEYQQIYFVGSSARDKIKGIPHTAANNGYDDERGDYRITMGDHLEYRYEVQSVLGRGSFGQVLKVFDHKKDIAVALKIIRNKKRFHHQALVEVKILEHLMGRDKEHKSNIVRVHGYFYFRNHLCITFETLSINLYEFIKNNNFKGISLGLIRRFAIQLLQSLSFLKKERIIHCDLKPENILLKSPNKSTIKLIDFGSSCFEDERVYTYIQSRFYRSPEVILGLPYDIAIDMWSFGAILSELYTGYPLFPGENETEQMQVIMEIMGPPPKRLVQESTRKKTFFDPTGKPLIVPNSRGKIRTPGSKDLAQATKCNDPQFLSFLRRCLRWDPKVRMTPEKAFEHPWISEVLNPGVPAKDLSVTPTTHGSGASSQVGASGSGGGGAGSVSVVSSSGAVGSRGEKTARAAAASGMTVAAATSSGTTAAAADGNSMRDVSPSGGVSTARKSSATKSQHAQQPTQAGTGGASTMRLPPAAATKALFPPIAAGASSSGGASTTRQQLQQQQQQQAEEPMH